MAYYIPGKLGPTWSKGLYGDIDYRGAGLHLTIMDCFPNLYICENDNLESPTDTMLLKEQKDAELDRKIEALRKKNEALMKRYKEVEEDKKRAEQEGMTLHCRKGKDLEDLTITINKSPIEKRVVTKKGSGATSPQSPQEQGEAGSAMFSAGRGKRRQLLVTTPGNTKGKRVVSERVDRSGPTGPVGTKLPDEYKEEPVESTAGGHHSLNTKRGTQAQTGRKPERKVHVDEASHGLVEYDPYPLGPDAVGADLEVTMSSGGQLEYMRWKKEREEIDRERVARHRNSQGQWRRAWDMDKPELMFSEKVHEAGERGTLNRGCRNPRKGHLRSLVAESRGHPVKQHDKRGKNVPVVGSKAKGKDRLTGRARRWDAKTEGEQVQACSETSLQEFLEELDALCDPEVDCSTRDTDAKEVEPSVTETVAPNIFTSTDTKTESEHVPAVSTETETVSSRGTETETVSSRGTEKKVRFLEDVQVACEKSCSTDPAESKVRSLKTTSRVKSAPAEEDTRQTSEDNQENITNTRERGVTEELLPAVHAKTHVHDDVEETSAEENSVQELSRPSKGFQTEGSRSSPKGSPCSTLSSQNGSQASASTEQELRHPLKNNTCRSTEELIDSSLSVLSLERGEPLPDHSTSTDKARENGKIV